MCRSFRCSAIAVCVWLTACTIPLDSTTDAAVTDAPDTLPNLTGCDLFADVSTTIGIGHSVTQTDGSVLWTLDGTVPGATRTDGLVIASPVALGRCPTGSTVDVALPAAGTDTDFATPLDLVRVGSDIWQFYEAWKFDATQPFGVRSIGRGVARWDPTTGHFARSGHLLWTADRPAYGTAVIRDGIWVFVYGCTSSDGGWSRACYVARAPAANLASSSAWQYATAVEQFTDDVDAAQPILLNVGDVSVRRHASGRLLVTYILPLDHVLRVRSALGPTGPFSAAHVLGSCDAPAGAFCVGAAQHPELEPDATTLALTFARSSFDPLPDHLRRPVLAFLPVPTELP